MEMDYTRVYEELGRLISDDDVLELVGQVVAIWTEESYQQGYRDGRRDEYALRSKAWGVINCPVIKHADLPPPVRAHIDEFLVENPTVRHPRTPREYLDVILEGHGIIRYTDDVIVAVQSIERATLSEPRKHR